MTGALLRTGTLKAFEPLGALGNPVYLAAAQLRAAIGRRLGADAANVLAIPHRNQDGDTVDWYAPSTGPVVPWSAASPEERASAKEQLLGVQGRIEELVQAMRSDEAGERQVFGRLLEHVTRFPDDGHVYLVDGRPVITFWGFRHQDAPVDGNPLLNLDVAPQQQELADKPRGPSRWWLLPLLLLLGLLLVWLLRGCNEAPSPTIPPDPGSQTPPAEAPSAPQELMPPPEEPPVEPPVEEPTEPAPVADPRRPHLVVRDGATRIIEQDRVRSDETTVVDKAVAVDPLIGETAGDLAPSGEADTTETLDFPDEVSEIDPAPTELADERTGDLEAEASEPDAGEDEPEADVPPEEAAEELAAEDEAAGASPSELVPEDEAAPEPTGEPLVSAEETDIEPPGEAPADETSPGDTPGAETPESTQSPQPPEPPLGAETEKPVETGKQQSPVDGAKSNAPDATTDSTVQSLKLPPGAVSRGSTQFLNGGWRTSTSLQDPRTALPVDMEYRLEDGAGNLSLKRSDGSVCSGQVKAVMQDGKLVVQNARDIKCPDGTNFGRPRLECVPGKDGRADCSGRYETGEVFSVDIKRSQEQSAEEKATGTTATRRSEEK